MPITINPTSQPITITLVEDSENLRLELMHQLTHLGYVVKGVENAKELDKLRKNWLSNIYILDVNLPGEDGFSIANRLAKNKEIGIIMLTARTDILDKIYGLEHGADIYLTKPIDWRELNACIKSIHRRLTPLLTTPLWLLDIKSQVLMSPNNQVLNLTKHDTKILTTLLKQPEEVVTRETLAEILEFKTLEKSEYRLNTIVFRLRQKLTDFDKDFTIHTYRGTGYALLGPKITIKERT